MDRDMGIVPYNFQPTFTPEEIAVNKAKKRRLSSGSSTSASKSQASLISSSGPSNVNEEDDQDEDGPRPPSPPPPPDRMANNDWCQCGNCAPLDRPIQCKCCKEIPNCRLRLGYLSQTQPCITMHDDFGRICLQKAVLRTALIARLDCRGHTHRGRLPEELENESYRYAAYRLFTYWVHGILGAGVRRVIPACAVSLIRNTFPAEEGHIHVGFILLPDGEMIEVPEEMAI